MGYQGELNIFSEENFGAGRGGGGGGHQRVTLEKHFTCWEHTHNLLVFVFHLFLKFHSYYQRGCGEWLFVLGTYAVMRQDQIIRVFILPFLYSILEFV